MTATATGVLADYVQVECPCGCLLLVPARMATEADPPRCFSCEDERREVEARKETARVTGKRKGRDGR